MKVLKGIFIILTLLGLAMIATFFLARLATWSLWLQLMTLLSNRLIDDIGLGTVLVSILALGLIYWREDRKGE